MLHFQMNYLKVNDAVTNVLNNSKYIDGRNWDIYYTQEIIYHLVIA